jgi:hypothetical protein
MEYSRVSAWIWKASQVRELVESLWLNYPIGTLLVWDNSGPVQPRSASDAQKPELWVVDGQQRATALCILSGRKPYWWPNNEGWNDIISKYDIRFDVDAAKAPYFVVANAATKKVRVERYIPVRDILNLGVSQDDDLKSLLDTARRIKTDGLCEGKDTTEVFTRLDRVRKIRDSAVVLITVDNDLEDVVDIFQRLNNRGTRVTEADIYLGIVASRTQGWVRENFLPFVTQLYDFGYDVSPNLVFRTLTGIGRKAVRYKYIDSGFWDAKNIQPAWLKTKKAWSLAVTNLKDYGISGNNLFPADNVLVSLTSLLDKFPKSDFSAIFFWMLQASRFGRYSSSSTSSMEEDLKEISEAPNLKTAVERLLTRIGHIRPLEADDFLRDYGDNRFGRLILYLLIVRNGAVDWGESEVRIGFDGKELLEGFQPQFHHIFPKKFLEGKVEPNLIDALANIAIIGPKINIRISKQDPMSYIPKYQITGQKLKQQMISTNIVQTSVSEYPKWLRQRAQLLAGTANKFLKGLQGDIRQSKDILDSNSVEHAFETA